MIPISGAELPTDKHPEQEVRDEANILSRGNDEVAEVLRGISMDRSIGQVIGDPVAGRYFVMSPISGTDWVLAGTIQSNAVAMTHRRNDQLLAISQQKMLISGIGLICGILLAFLLATIEGRRILSPLRILISRVSEAAHKGKNTPVAVSDEGEIGELANAIQELMDSKAAAEDDKGS